MIIDPVLGKKKSDRWLEVCTIRQQQHRRYLNDVNCSIDADRRGTALITFWFNEKNLGCRAPTAIVIELVF